MNILFNSSLPVVNFEPDYDDDDDNDDDDENDNIISSATTTAIGIKKIIAAFFIHYKPLQKIKKSISMKFLFVWKRKLIRIIKY